jgi:hypothetical protein
MLHSVGAKARSPAMLTHLCSAALTMTVPALKSRR